MDWVTGGGEQGGGGGGLLEYVGLEGLLSIASLGLSAFSYRQERRHFVESRGVEKKHHDIVLDLEKRLHKEQVNLTEHTIQMDKRRHTESVKLSENLHDQSIKIGNRLHQIQLCSALEQHLQDITSDLIVAGKEADRDMWDQRNAQFQTLLLSATVMFAAGMAVIVEGELPTETPEFIIIGYCVSVGCSFAFLFVSIILCIKIVVSMSAFMYKLTNRHQSVVTKLVVKASEVMSELFDIQENAAETGDQKDQKYMKDSEDEYKRKLTELSKKRRQINQYMANHYLNKRLLAKDRRRKHQNRRRMGGESKSGTNESSGDTRYLNRQDNKNNALEMPTIPSMTEFESFWFQTLRYPARLSMILFYTGTVCLLSAIAFLIFSRLTLNLSSKTGAYTFVAFIGASLLIGVWLAIFLKLKPNNSGPLEDQSENLAQRSYANLSRIPSGVALGNLYARRKDAREQPGTSCRRPERSERVPGELHAD